MKFTLSAAALLSVASAEEFFFRCNESEFTDELFEIAVEHFKVKGEELFDKKMMEKVRLGDSFDSGTVDFAGFFVDMDEDDCKAIMEAYPNYFVEYVPNAVANILETEELTCNVQSNARPNLARLSTEASATNGRNGNYLYPNMGTGTRVYVVDTGINVDHNDFEGRAFALGDATGEGLQDDNGHGTHVAGISGSATYGVAKNTTLYSFKSLGANGSGSLQSTVVAVRDAVNHWIDDGRPPAVINLSLGFQGIVQNFDDFLSAVVATGIPVVVAAGNDNQNACGFSPARAEDVVSVGSTTSSDSRSSFSNFGECVEIFAVGSNIVSLTWLNNFGLETMSGTSQASPHVAGLSVLLLEQNPDLTPAQLTELLRQTAESGVIQNVGAQSPNLLAQVSCNSTGLVLNEDNDNAGSALSISLMTTLAVGLLNRLF